MSVRFATTTALALCACFAQTAWAQVRPLHTRDATRLSEVQLAAHLERSDIIFIPVGAVEANGVMPSGRDYVSALGFCMAMAEETGGLYAPGLAHSYPGTTVVGSSTIYMSPTQGFGFLRSLARSLLRQGFRRQVLVSISHGPAALTAGTLARQFFEEERVPILFVDIDAHIARLGINREERSLTVYGAHALTGRLEDIPLQGDYGALPEDDSPPNEGLARLRELGYAGSLTLGSWIPNALAHAGSLALAATPAERARWGEQGREQIQEIVRKMRLPEAMEALKQHDGYTQRVIVPKFADRLPKTLDSF
jgi:creatinine amidohydrolase